MSGLKIGVYQHSTVARDLFVDVLAHYGADVVSLGRSETFIPVDTEAVSLKRWSFSKNGHRNTASMPSFPPMVTATGPCLPMKTACRCAAT